MARAISSHIGKSESKLPRSIKPKICCHHTPSLIPRQSIHLANTPSSAPISRNIPPNKAMHDLLSVCSGFRMPSSLSLHFFIKSINCPICTVNRYISFIYYKSGFSIISIKNNCMMFAVVVYYFQCIVS